MSDDSVGEDGFFSRWSGRKAATREGLIVEETDIPEQLEIAKTGAEIEIADEDLPIPEDLPDIETLDKDSDYSLFMRKGTPEHLKRLALRKLFLSDPSLAVLDGLNDYDEDYSMIGMVVEEVTTRFKPGKGMVDPDEEKPQEDPKEITEDEALDPDKPDEALTDDSETAEAPSDEEAEADDDDDDDDDDLIADDGDLEG